MGRLKLSVALLVLTMSWQVSTAVAQEEDGLNNQNCTAILESYAANPKSVPKSVADACQQAINIAPGAGSPKPVAAAPAVDPCAGPGAQSSVQCWGPWAPPLSPAAGGATPPAATLKPHEYPTRPEILAIKDPDPVTPCDPGLPCGFATVVDGIGNVDTADNTTFARFDLAQDGTEFIVDAVDGRQFDSVDGMGTIFTARPDNYENMRSAGADGDLRSRLVARVLRQGSEIQAAGDVWAHGNAATGIANSGFFAWGVAISQADIDSLTNLGGTLNFSGVMSVDNSTVANISMTYGSSSTWSGDWTNPAYSFSAGGAVAGAGFLSDPAQFSSNVNSGFVQGGLVGSSGSRAAAHIIEVDLQGHGLVRDVGLLGETGGTGPGPTPLP